MPPSPQVADPHRRAAVDFVGIRRPDAAARRPNRPRAAPLLRQQRLTGRILGRAVYDTASERFVAFDMLAVGETWRAPWRAADAAPSSENRQVIPLGIGFSLAADTPSARIPPGFVELYGWDRPSTVRRTQRESVRRRTETEPVD